MLGINLILRLRFPPGSSLASIYTVLYYAILCYTMLCNTMLYRTMLDYTRIYYAILYNTALKSGHLIGGLASRDIE